MLAGAAGAVPAGAGGPGAAVLCRARLGAVAALGSGHRAAHHDRERPRAFHLTAFQAPLVFASLMALAALAALGIVLYALMAILERRFTGWAYR